MVASILVGAMILNRKRNFAIFDKRKPRYSLLDEDRDTESARSSDELLSPDYRNANIYEDDEFMDSISTLKNPPKRRRCCCAIIYTPNTSRFADYYHSRLLQKFPFLIEMFYWIITYAFYRCTRVLSEAIFMERGILGLAEGHGHAILEFEDSSLHHLLPHEVSVQRWFLHGHQTLLTVLNRSYALIHIPGTVGYSTPPVKVGI